MPFVLHDTAPIAPNKDSPAHVLMLSADKWQKSLCNENFELAFASDKASSDSYGETEFSFAKKLLSYETAQLLEEMQFFEDQNKKVGWRASFDLASYSISRQERELRFAISLRKSSTLTSSTTPTVDRQKFAALTSRLPDTANYKQMESVTRTTLLKESDKIIGAVRARMTKKGKHLQKADTYFSLPIFFPKPKSSLAQDMYLFGDPCNPDEAMNSLNERKVFRNQVAKIAISFESNTEFRAPERILAVYPKVVYDRLNQGVAEDKLLEGVHKELLEVPEDLEKELIKGTYVARLIAGNHGYVAACELSARALADGAAPDRSV